MASREFVQVIPPGRLVCGMLLPVVAQSSYLAAPWERGAGVEEILRVARACDDAGLFSLAVCDHVAIPRSRAASMSTVWYDAVATLGYLAAATRRVRLLSYVYVLPYRHPLMAAKAFATLDALSSGRAIVGVGAGHLEDEFRALGVDFARRGRLVDEAIDVLAAALAHEFPEHTGPTWSIAGLGVAPRPVQRPRPPIWVGGSTPAALRRAALRGDGWVSQAASRADLRPQIAYLRERRRELHGEAPIEVAANGDWLYVGRPGWDVGAAVTGSAERIAASIRELGRLDVNHVGVRFRSRSCDELVDQVRAFGAEVLPLLAD